MKKKLLHPGGRWETAGRHLVEALEKMEGLGVAQSDFRAYGTGPVSMETVRQVVESNGVEWFNNIDELMASVHTDRYRPWTPEGVTMDLLETLMKKKLFVGTADPKVRLRRPGAGGAAAAQTAGLADPQRPPDPGQLGERSRSGAGRSPPRGSGAGAGGAGGGRGEMGGTHLLLGPPPPPPLHLLGQRAGPSFVALRARRTAASAAEFPRCD